MSRWYEHPVTNKLLEGDQVLNVLSYINEAKNNFNEQYGDPKTSQLDEILKLWPEKSSVKKEWLRRVLDNGPMNDKIQSMGSVISEFPMYSLYYLDHLISLVNLNKKRLAIISSDLLTKIFITYFLPKSRPLINLNERPLSLLVKMTSNPENTKKKNVTKTRKKILVLWYFEEQLKTRFSRFLTALEELLKNEPDKTNKIKIINQCYKLSEAKENQSHLIDILVNKLGDLNTKVTGCAFSKLSDIVHNNSTLMPKIVRSIRKFVFRPNLSKKAQYYAIQLLAQCQINKQHLSVQCALDCDATNDSINTSSNIATEMVQIYIGVFKRRLEASQSSCEKLYSALLAGLARALPFAQTTDVQNYTNSIFKIVHSSNLALAISGLRVLLSLVGTASNITKSEPTEGQSDNFDRYMRLLYSTLLNPSALFNSQRGALVELVFKSVASDSDTSRATALVKRLLQLCLHHPESGFVCTCLLFLSRVLGSKHQAMFDRLSRVEVNSEILTKMPRLTGDSGQVVMNDETSDSDSDEEASENKEDSEENKARFSSWVHYRRTEIETSIATTAYDPTARNPKYAHADSEKLVELEMLAKHYHPSVRTFASSIIEGQRIVYKTDPNEDLSLARFLDRFAFKNPKKTDTKRRQLGPGVALAAAADKDNVKSMMVHSKEFADLAESAVPQNEKFFHTYFNHAKRLGLKVNGGTGDNEEIDSDFEDSDTEFDNFLLRDTGDDKLNMSGSEMGDSDAVDDEDEEEDEDVYFSDYEDEDGDELLRDDDDNKPEEDGLEHMSVDEDSDEQEEEDTNGAASQSDDVSASEDDDGSMEDEQQPQEETIHSSKRKRLGAELADITTGALTFGKSLDNIKQHATDKIRTDRKRRKRAKNIGPNKRQKTTGKPTKKRAT